MSRRPSNAWQLERELLARTPKSLAGVQALLAAAAASRKVKAHTDETTALQVAQQLVIRLRYLEVLRPVLSGPEATYSLQEVTALIELVKHQLSEVEGQRWVEHALRQSGVLQPIHGPAGTRYRFAAEEVANG